MSPAVFLSGTVSASPQHFHTSVSHPSLTFVEREGRDGPSRPTPDAALVAAYMTRSPVWLGTVFPYFRGGSAATPILRIPEIVFA